MAIKVYEDEKKEAERDTAYCPWYFPDKMVEEAADWLDRKKLGEVAFYTPDYPKLARKDAQLVFVYGTLKKGYKNHDCLRRGKFLCQAVTKDKDLVMFHSQGDFPVVIGGIHAGDAPRAHIQGELYEIPTSDTKYLDWLEGTPQLFVRAKVILKLLHPYCNKDGTQLISAFMYVGNPRAFNANSMKLKCTEMFTRKENPLLTYYTYIKPGSKLRNEKTAASQ